MIDDLTLRVAGRDLAGWTEITVTCGIERMPSAFQIVASERSPSLRDAIGVPEGSVCTVLLGSDVVVTGYVDTVEPMMAAGTHAVRMTGRGKCQDLVDCAAEWKSCQISGSNALEIATKLSAPYGITARSLADPGPPIPQFNINVGDTPAMVLEMITRHAALLYYEDASGELVLAQAGSGSAASGVAEGFNVQAASWIRSLSGRYSEYVCSLESVDVSGLFEEHDGLFYHTEFDPNVSRHRRLVIVAEAVSGGNGLELAQKRAVWESARRAGRARALSVTVDSWRDQRGKLWTPNTMAPVSLPTLGLTGVNWLISEVTFKRSEGPGTTADLKLMPRESFLPQPILLQPQIYNAIGRT